MQKGGIIIVASGGLIVLGLILLVVGNQIILEDVVQENGKVSSGQALIVSNEFNSQETNTGVFAVQIMQFRENTFSVKLLDPYDMEIFSQNINNETIEEEFEIIESGKFKLIIDSNSIEEAQVFGAIGPLPDSGKKILGFISIYVLLIGMGGLVIVAVLGVKNRKKSV